MDALSDYICKSNELVDKMVCIHTYIHTKDSYQKRVKGPGGMKKWRDIGGKKLRCLRQRLERARRGRNERGRQRGRGASFRERVKWGMENEANRRGECVIAPPLLLSQSPKIRGKERIVNEWVATADREYGGGEGAVREWVRRRLRKKVEKAKEP